MHRRLTRYHQLVLSLLALLATFTAAIVVLNQVGLPLIGIDDAHIFLVYGKNMVNSQGLVYNPGGERVEGFSSFLWLLIIGLGYLAFPRPETFLLVVSLLIVSAAVAMLASQIDRKKLLSLSGMVFIAWVFSSPAYAAWTSLTLMDTALWSALLMLGVACALTNKPVGLALVASAMVLARPEGMLWAPALILVAVLPTWVERGPWAALGAVRPALLAYFVTLTALTIGRLLYFGYPLPNTYYVKMSPDIIYNLQHGFGYMVAFLYVNPVALLGIVPAIVALIMNGRWLARAIIRPGSNSASDARLNYISVSLIALLALLVPVYMGGDHFGNFRFYQPAWPLLILPAFALLRVLKIRAPQPIVYLAAFVIVMLAFLLPKANWFNQNYKDSFIHEIEVAQEGLEVARAMNVLFAAEEPSVGAVRAGAVALGYDGDVVDLMGLNNVAMAHAPGDRKGVKNHAAFNADVFFAQRPEIILPMPTSPAVDLEALEEKLAWDNAVLKGLLADPRFVAAYDLVTISDGQSGILAYADRAFLRQLPAQQLKVEPFDDLVLSVAGG